MAATRRTAHVAHAFIVMMILGVEYCVNHFLALPSVMIELDLKVVRATLFIPLTLFYCSS